MMASRYSEPIVPLPMSSATRGIIRAYCGARMASGMIPIILAPSCALKIDSLRPSERCFHHDDNHSCVRKTQADALDSSSAFHSSRSVKNSSVVPISLTIMRTAPGEVSEFLRPYTQLRQVSRPDELESPANDGGGIRRPIRRDDFRDHRSSRIGRFLCLSRQERSRQPVYF